MPLMKFPEAVHKFIHADGGVYTPDERRQVMVHPDLVDSFLKCGFKLGRIDPKPKTPVPEVAAPGRPKGGRKGK